MDIVVYARVALHRAHEKESRLLATFEQTVSVCTDADFSHVISY